MRAAIDADEWLEGRKTELHTLYKNINGQEEKGHRRIGTRRGYIPLSFVLWNHIRRTKSEKGH